jgi:hypothetical protein
MNQNYKWVAQVSPLRPGGHSTRLNTLRKNALYEGHGFQPCPGVCTFIQRCGGLRVPTGQPKKMMREKREKPPQRDAAEVFPQARFSRNDKMVHDKRGKRGKFSCRSIFLCPCDSWQRLRFPGNG